MMRCIVYGVDRNPPMKNFDLNPELDSEVTPLLVEANMSPENSNVRNFMPIVCAGIRYREDIKPEKKCFKFCVLV